MSEHFRFYVCVSGLLTPCGYVQLAIAHETCVIPNYCPRCEQWSFWQGPMSTRTHTLRGNPLKRKKSA